MFRFLPKKTTNCQLFRKINGLSSRYLPVVSTRIKRNFSSRVEDDLGKIEELMNDTKRLEQQSVRFQLVEESARRKIGVWLIICAGAVLGMIVLGGYTRLSKSGLSMTKWKPIQYKYPSTPAQWVEEFEHYQVFIGFDGFRNSQNIN